ncbi:MAG: Lipoprotein signal peptidase [Syntrophus sp. PtaB.Bin001]|nr:MAG: Lipoprotein signal peptidase [Syntrophus sp. PtaB.Bin001]
MKRSIPLFLITVGLVVLLDQITKSLIVSNFLLHESMPVVDGLFNITYVRNPGAAFGFMSGASPAFRGIFFSLVTLIAVSLILYHLVKNRIADPFLAFALALVVAGALGNLLDRLRYGEVIDFLDVYISGYHWPAFNIADTAISIGAVFLIVEMVRRREPDI